MKEPCSHYFLLISFFFLLFPSITLANTPINILVNMDTIFLNVTNSSSEIQAAINNSGYYNITAQMCYYLNNATERAAFLSTYNATYEAGGNASWNETRGNEIYYPLTGNPSGFLTAFTEVDPRWSGNYTALNASWSTTYNITYDTATNNSWNETRANALYVPYTGANTNVDLGAKNLTTTGYGQFQWQDILQNVSVITTPPSNTLRLYVENIKGFSFYKYLDSTGMKRELVRDSMILVKNVRGTTIPANRFVYATGSQDNVPTVDLAKANSIDTMPAIGITLEAITNGSYGRVMQVGLLENVDTTYDSFAEGDILYVSDVTGGIAKNSPPLIPNLSQEMGTILVLNETTGAIQIITRNVEGNEFGTINNFSVASGKYFLGNGSQLTDITGSGNTTTQIRAAQTVNTTDQVFTVCNNQTFYLKSNPFNYLNNTSAAYLNDTAWVISQSYQTGSELTNTTDEVFTVCNNNTFSSITEPRWAANYTAFTQWNKTYADTLYISVSNTSVVNNASFNETRTDALYISISNTSVVNNNTWNETRANALYVVPSATNVSNNTLFCNGGTCVAASAANISNNSLFLGGVAAASYLTAETDPRWQANYTALNISWSTTSNATYNAFVVANVSNVAASAQTVSGGWVNSSTGMKVNNNTKIYFGTLGSFCMYYNSTLGALVSTNVC